MPEAIISRILRLAGHRVYAWEADDATGVLWLSIRQMAATPYYVCGGCGGLSRPLLNLAERSSRASYPQFTAVRGIPT